jgi:DNA-binding IclR family transcriptional regulator
VNKHDSINKNQSLKKALNILEIMADYKEGSARLQDIAHDLGMSPSTVLRFLNTFIEYGYINQDALTSRYYLTLKLADLGDRNRRNYPFHQALRKFLKEITSTFNESASLCIESNMQMVYIATEDGPSHMLQTLSRIGRIAPMHATGVGKLYLAEYSDSQLRGYVDKMGLKRLTDNTYIKLETLKEELNSIRQQDYAIDNEECEMGIKCIAVPIRDYTGKIVAAMSLSAPITRLNAHRTMEIILYLKELSKRASVELGWKSPDVNSMLS